MVMSRNQNAGGSHSIKIDDSSFERVEQFNYLGTTLTFQNSIQEEIKSRLNSGKTRVGTLIVATIYLQLIQNRYMFLSFTVLQ